MAVPGCLASLIFYHYLNDRCRAQRVEVARNLERMQFKLDVEKVFSCTSPAHWAIDVTVLEKHLNYERPSWDTSCPQPLLALVSRPKSLTKPEHSCAYPSVGRKTTVILH